MRDNVPEQAEEVLRRHRIEQGADVAVGGDLLDAEQGLAVRAAVPLGELALVGQEGGALYDEHREGAQANVGHGVARIRPGAAVRQRRAAAAQAADQGVENLHEAGGSEIAASAKCSRHRKTELPTLCGAPDSPLARSTHPKPFQTSPSPSQNP